MLFLDGKFAQAKVFTDNIDNKAMSQIVELLNQPFAENSHVRIMPDVHAGVGCVIGFTANLSDKVIANLVGVDLGCGMLTMALGNQKIDLSRLDEIIHEHVPSGFHAHDTALTHFHELQDLLCLEDIDKGSLYHRQLGTLGGGNHFIEIDIDDDGNQYLVIHSGSRNLGKMIAEYYQDMAIADCTPSLYFQDKRKELIESMKQNGKTRFINKVLKEFDAEIAKAHPLYPRDLCFVAGQHREDYLHDMRIAQNYASLNRYLMANTIIDGLDIVRYDAFETVHNYIGDDNIIRKGAVSAKKGEQLLIPINMRDGSLLCVGKGNKDWNESAPHGAGRLMSRSEAKRQLTVGEFEEDMQEVFSTSVGQSTLDESPRAYKPMQEIIDNIQDTVEIKKIIKPIYNFKAN